MEKSTGDFRQKNLQKNGMLQLGGLAPEIWVLTKAFGGFLVSGRSLGFRGIPLADAEFGIEFMVVMYGNHP